MSIWVDVAQGATGLNVVLLLLLCYVWGRNFFVARTKHTIGLLLFAVFLLAENAFAFYYYLVDPALSAWFSTQVPIIAWRAMMLVQVLETVGLLFLTWATWD